MNPIANLPQRFSEAVTGRGAHLQVQFLVKNEQGDINLVPEAFIFRNDRSNLDDLDVYPVKKGGYSYSNGSCRYDDLWSPRRICNKRENL